MRNACLIAMASALLGLARLCAAAEPAALRLEFKETSFGKIHTGARDPDFSEDGMHVAYAVKRPDGWIVVVDGKESKTYEWVLANSLKLSRDGKHVAFIVQAKDGMFVVRDGVEGPKHREVSHLWATRDGERYAYVARNEPGPACSVIVDGKEYAKANNAKNVHFSPDGKRVAFSADAGKENQRAWHVDGTAGEAFDALGPMVFSADGARWAHMGQRGDSQLIVVDGTPGKVYRKANGAIFSPDGKRLAFAAEQVKDRKSEFFIVVDGAEGRAYDMVSAPVFSPDSKRLAYVGIVKKIQMAVVDGEEGAGHDLVGDVAFSADSRHVAYRVADDNRWKLIVNDRESAPYDRVGFFAISPDGAHVAFAARKEAADYMVLDGQEHPGAGQVSMSPDGRFFAHGEDSALKSTVRVNGAKGNSYDGFLRGSRWTWIDSDRFVLFAGREMELLRVEVRVGQ